jgi:hypothetical protein
MAGFACGVVSSGRPGLGGSAFRLLLGILIAPLPAAASPCGCSLYQDVFEGSVARGDAYRYEIPGRLVFALEPSASGWLATVRAPGRDEDLARLTPPLHFAPNPREIEGWQFTEELPAGCAAPYGAQSGPGERRDFIFSPEVGRSIAGPTSSAAVTPDDLADVEAFGRGTLWIEGVDLTADADGCPRIEALRFKVEVAVSL